LPFDFEVLSGDFSDKSIKPYGIIVLKKTE